MHCSLPYSSGTQRLSCFTSTRRFFGFMSSFAFSSADFLPCSRNISLLSHTLNLGCSVMRRKAAFLFCNCDRFSRDVPTAPLALWMMRTPVSDLFWCWPPGPPEGNVWISQSSSVTENSFSRLMRGTIQHGRSHRSSAAEVLAQPAGHEPYPAGRSRAHVLRLRGLLRGRPEVPRSVGAAKVVHRAGN